MSDSNPNLDSIKACLLPGVPLAITLTCARVDGHVLACGASSRHVTIAAYGDGLEPLQLGRIPPMMGLSMAVSLVGHNRPGFQWRSVRCTRQRWQQITALSFSGGARRSPRSARRERTRFSIPRRRSVIGDARMRRAHHVPRDGEGSCSTCIRRRPFRASGNMPCHDW